MPYAGRMLRGPPEFISMAISPRISIIMAAYNAEPHIEPALDSLTRQTFDDWELIVVDDGSQDATCAIVSARAERDARIRCIRLDVNGGPAIARNAGLAVARGEWLTVLDSDDRYEANRLEVLLDRATRDGLDIIADNLLLYDEAAHSIICRGFAFAGETRALTPALLVANDGPPRIASLGHLKPFIRRDFLTGTGVTYPAEARLGEDFCFLFELLRRTERATLIDYAGYVYTLPFSAARGERASGTRTSYGADGLDDLRRTNGHLVDALARDQGGDRRLLAQLSQRGARLRDEGAWRQARRHVKARDFLAAARLLSRIDVSFGWAQLLRLMHRRKGRFQTALR